MSWKSFWQLDVLVQRSPIHRVPVRQYRDQHVLRYFPCRYCLVVLAVQMPSSAGCHDNERIQIWKQFVPFLQAVNLVSVIRPRRVLPVNIYNHKIIGFTRYKHEMTISVFRVARKFDRLLGRNVKPFFYPWFFVCPRIYLFNCRRHKPWKHLLSVIHVDVCLGMILQQQVSICTYSTLNPH